MKQTVPLCDITKSCTLTKFASSLSSILSELKMHHPSHFVFCVCVFVLFPRKLMRWKRCVCARMRACSCLGKSEIVRRPPCARVLWQMHSLQMKLCVHLTATAERLCVTCAEVLCHLPKRRTRPFLLSFSLSDPHTHTHAQARAPRPCSCNDAPALHGWME